MASVRCLTANIDESIDVALLHMDTVEMCHYLCANFFVLLFLTVRIQLFVVSTVRRSVCLLCVYGMGVMFKIPWIFWYVSYMIMSIYYEWYGELIFIIRQNKKIIMNKWNLWLIMFTRVLFSHTLKS